MEASRARTGRDALEARNRQGCLVHPCLVFFVQSLGLAMPFFEDDDDPKKPRPVHSTKKTEGWRERGETRKDDDRDHHRHVHVRC